MHSGVVRLAWVAGLTQPFGLDSLTLGEVMDVDWIDRRRVRPVRVHELRHKLNAAQADMLQTLEQVGWSLRFVRMEGDTALAAVHNPDKNTLAIIDPSGALVENPKLKFRV